ncbi:MAG: M23 family metallopeptidase [Candidatus Levybacteria bacterium]|nr:M23 family metallopeptidase [Candidatus Levybacteria bacterium]
MRKNRLSYFFWTFFPQFISEFIIFFRFLLSYLKKKIITWYIFFERNKNILVKFFTMKRGRYNRSFLHFSAAGVLGIGIILAPFLASTYPVFSTNASVKIDSPSTSQSIIVGENSLQTEISEKPRDKIIIYTVQKGDTVSTIAQKFGISANTVRWENGLSNDNLSVGDELRILPVTGIAHKVVKGDTVYSIAKKFDTEAQRIADFPFNDFANPETFSLVAGQILIVPDGVKPSEQPYIKRQVYIAQGPVSVSSAGFTWPVRGVVSQFATWYHMAIDILSPIGTPIVAAQDGVVSRTSVGTWDGGYGTSVYISGDTYGSHYAHMSAVNVSAGDKVAAGKTVIGWIGMTGRTTGAHVHFEISRNGTLINPLPFLQ